ncbi:MAG: hypothetical protein AABY89_01090 [Acidobacteriota bacterium]
MMPNSHASVSHIPQLAARTLACAVIKQALSDALDPTTPTDVRKDAQAFLAGDQWYQAWCTAGGYKPTPMLSRHTV